MASIATGQSTNQTTLLVIQDLSGIVSSLATATQNLTTQRKRGSPVRAETEADILDPFITLLQTLLNILNTIGTSM